MTQISRSYATPSQVDKAIAELELYGFHPAAIHRHTAPDGTPHLSVDAPFGQGALAERILDDAGPTGTAGPHHHAQVSKDDPAPFSKMLGWKVLIDNPAPFSWIFGMKVLTKGRASLSAALKMPELTDNAAPLSNAVKLPVLSNNPAPLSNMFKMPLLSNKAAPFSSLFGMKLLSDPKPGVQADDPIRTLSAEPAPFSKMLGLKVLITKS